MYIEKVKKYINNGNTLLGIGPMSLNTVNAAIEIADDYDIPIMLIASRRQIDSEKIKRGYVNNWSSHEFVKYIQKKQKKDNIIIARDHGGPWQNNIEIEKHLNLKEAIKSAKDSFQEDIDSGFNIIHIDPSVDIYEQIDFNRIMDRLIELYVFCSSYASKIQKDIEFEVGTEEQMIYSNNMFEFSMNLKSISEACIENHLKNPLFVVTQIGTKVAEMQNIGILNKNSDNAFKKVIDLCNLCLENKFFIKVHNTDYLNNEILKKFPILKVSAANVAPEFGLCETKALVKLMEKYDLISLKNKFLELAYDSRKWEKWIINGSNISKENKAIIAAHYIFSTKEFLKIKENIQKNITNIDINDYLKNEVKKNILNYVNCFTKDLVCQN